MAPKRKVTKEEEVQELLVEDLVRRGWIIRPLPENVLAELTEAHEDDPDIPCWPAVRFNKLTHKMRKDIAVEVQRQYNADLRDETLLSTAQILKLTEARGEWTTENVRRVDELQMLTGQLMRELTMASAEEQQAWAPSMQKLYSELHEELRKENEEHADILQRWTNHTEALQPVYNMLYAGDQGAEEYSADRDFIFLQENVPFGMLDRLQELERMTIRLAKFFELDTYQKELGELLKKQNKIFNQSIENRRDTMEAVVRLSRMVQWVDEHNEVQGQVEDPEALPESVLEWLVTENHFFIQGIPPETREYLQQWGFLPAPQEHGSSDSSDESPVEPSSNSSSDVSSSTPASSSEPLIPTS